MITFTNRLQSFTITHPSGVDTMCIYDATPEEIPSVMFFIGKNSRSTPIVVEEFLPYMNTYDTCKGYGPIPVGIVEDFLATYAVEKVERYRGRSEA